MTETLADIFRAEACELLAELEFALLELEADGGDTETIAQVFRTLHTLKGAGTMTGFESVSSVVHEVETAFELVRRGKLTVSRELIDLTLLVRDQVRQMVTAEPTSELDPATCQLIAQIEAFIGHPPARSQQTIMQKQTPMTAEAVDYHIRFTPAADLFQSGVNPIGVLRELALLGDCRPLLRLDNILPLENLDPERCALEWEIQLTTTATEAEIRDAFVFVAGEKNLSISRTPATISATPPAQISAATTPRRQGKKSDIESRTGIRVQTDRLDALVDLVGEMVTLQARLSRMTDDNDNPDLLSLAEDVERLTWEMRDHVLNIRMLPIGTTFSKFRRLVRDLSAQLGKEVELCTEGADTELDKMMLEKLQEPLMHLLRNSIDHGIEAPEARRRAGKPALGRIQITARQSGPSVILRISDDGAGIDRDAIRYKALEMGMDKTAIDHLSEKELMAMIFHAGFSTARKLTSISGRGVGMDAVRQAIESLRGSVEVESSRHIGTTFTIRLPLTLAIIDGLLVRVSDDHFVFPLSAVEECIELHCEDVLRSGDKQLIELRNEIIPYIHLRERFAIAGQRPDIEQVVIADIDGQRIGFAVDHVIGSHQTVIKSMSRFYRDVQCFSGATILGDGKVALILDLQRLLLEAELAESRLVA